MQERLRKITTGVLFGRPVLARATTESGAIGHVIREKRKDSIGSIARNRKITGQFKINSTRRNFSLLKNAYNPSHHHSNLSAFA